MNSYKSGFKSMKSYDFSMQVSFKLLFESYLSFTKQIKKVDGIGVIDKYYNFNNQTRKKLKTMKFHITVSLT